MKENKRILLKISGEALGSKSSILDKNILSNLLEQIKYIKENYHVQVAIVVGGGNIFRGAISEDLGMGADTSPADYMGMMSTSINALGITTFLNNNGLKAEMQNSLNFEKISNVVDPVKAKQFLDEEVVVVFGGGTGKPFVSTDTAAAMRAIEIDADAILMAKNGVDGVYSADPKIDPNAEFYSELTFDDVLERNLKVVDPEAMNLLKGKEINIILFNMNTPNNIINLYKNKETRKTTIKDN